MAITRRGRDQRLVSRCRVAFDRPSGPVIAETEDISPRGLFIRTEALLPVGEDTEIRLELPDGEMLVLHARVAHMLTPVAARALGRHPGMGFELVGEDTPDRIKLRSHLDGMKTEITSPGLGATTEVVVVEPSGPLRMRMKRALETAGFKVTAVPTAMLALETCATNRPDAIVSAGTMDAMSGVDLAHAMSEHATLSDVPLVLTGDDGDLGRLEAYRAGVRDCIPTPFLDEELVIRVHRVIVPAQPVVNPGLRGSIEDIALGTLLSLFEFERKSGMLLLTREEEVVRLFVSEGRVHKVEGNPGPGAPKHKLLRLLDWHQGHFEFSPCAISIPDEIMTTVTSLLLEHARRHDEESAPHRIPR